MDTNEVLDTILVCGGRDYANRKLIHDVLAPYLPAHPRDGTPTVVHGDAPGADRIAGDVSKRLGFWVEPHPANWVRFARGAAGPMRNKRMAQRVARDLPRALCIAFPGGSGTANMIALAERWGIPVRRISN